MLKSTSNLDLRLKRLYDVSQAFKDIGLHHVIFDGALLGLIRDGHLIEWDWDAEIAVRFDDYNNLLLKIIQSLEGLRLGRLVVNRSKLNPKISLLVDDFKYTVLPFRYTEDSEIIERRLYKYPSIYLDSVIERSFNNYVLPIPKDSISLLSLQYGDNWRIPLKSNVKDEYLSRQIYTDTNNYIFLIYIYILSCFKKFFNIQKKVFNLFISKYPTLEYKLGLGRERLFIYQLMQQARHKPKVKLIEIGSSDLVETSILSNCLNKKYFKSDIYEATESTYNNLLKIKVKRNLKNVQIKNLSIVPTSTEYKLKIGSTPNLNKLVLSKNYFDATYQQIQDNLETLPFEKILDISNSSIHRIIKMDIEGLEENIINQNLDLLITQSNISICFEIHQNLYNDKERFSYSLFKLLNFGYKLRFIECALFCDNQIVSYYKKKNHKIHFSDGRYLIENPESSIINEIVNCSYKLLPKFPFYKSRNVRSVTFTKK